MSFVVRGAKNAFRNITRTLSIVVILALSVGLALTMLIARQAVQERIDSVKSSVGNTITIAPAGFNPGSDANNALTTDDLSKVQAISHVTSVAETLTDRLSTTGSTQPDFGKGASSTSATTSLTSPVKLNAGGSGRGEGGGRFFVSGGGGGQLPANFTLPVSFLGTNDPTSVGGSSAKITSGTTIDGTKDTNDALISTDMATKNNLSVGSTFTAYNVTLTVVGLFDSGTQGGNGTVVLSLPAEQRLSGQTGTVTSALATVDSLDNLSAATSAIEASLGSSADVTSSQDQANDTVAPLKNITSITLYSLIGAVAAGAVIIFLTMLMIVRERRREIGVFKAIGTSNIKIVTQFVSEAGVLTLMGAAVGIVAGALFAGSVVKVLVSSSTSTNNNAAGAAGKAAGFVGGGGGGGGFGHRVLSSGGDAINNIHAAVGWDILLYGLLGAVVIALIGSAIPAYLIAKVRPAEVMRGE